MNGVSDITCLKKSWCYKITFYCLGSSYEKKIHFPIYEWFHSIFEKYTE